MRGEMPEHMAKAGKGSAWVFCAALALGACQNGAEQSDGSAAQPSSTKTAPLPSETATTLPATAATVTAERCNFLRAVTPGKYFNPDNAAKVEGQLDLLEDLRDGTADIGFREIGLAGGIIRASFEDPLFAEAVLQANVAIENGNELDAEEFLALPVRVPERCDQEVHLSEEAARRQLEQVIAIGGALTGGIAAQLGSDVSALTRNAFEELQNTYEQIRDRLRPGDF
jgi:hypothetical protein